MTEHDEAVALVETLDLMNISLWHIPQETFTPHWGVKMRNKKEGVRKGISDYLIYLPSERCKLKKGILLWIELKKPRNRKKSGEFCALSSDGITIYPEQEDFIKKMNTVGNVQGQICFGAEEAVAFVQNFLLKS